LVGRGEEGGEAANGGGGAGRGRAALLRLGYAGQGGVGSGVSDIIMVLLVSALEIIAVQDPFGCLLLDTFLWL